MQTEIARPTKMAQLIKKASPKREKAACSKHGEYDSKIFFFGQKTRKTGCPICRDMETARKKEADIRSVSKHEITWLTEKNRTMNFGNYGCYDDQQKDIYNRLVNYVNNFEKVFRQGTSMALLGTPGTGKTHFATSIGIEVNKKKYNVFYELFRDMMSRIKATYKQNSMRTESEIMKNLTCVDLLIIDEVGQKPLSPTDKELILTIVNNRYKENKPTILISNLNESQLESELGRPVVDRFYENNGVVFTFEWESFRRR